ncbi:MAG TPA: NAD(P)-dependent oxidoreductase [Actinomycetota bacterium]|nr:NAD(P)-dependent oxidoreductase [Actinomycetota bacterium]
MSRSDILPTVAILGTGRMGAAMVGTLRRAGFDVIVWNRDRGKCDAIARTSGAEVAASAGEAAEAGNIAITSLADDAAVQAVYGDAFEGFHDGQVVLEMSTIAPETVRAIEPSVRVRGARLLDAPVSGSVPVVERGELLIMSGGEAEALDRARPVLEAMSTKIIHAGALGTGATMKLAVNALVHGLNAALSESLVLAERAGVDRTAAYEVFASGAAAAPYVLYKRAAFERPDETPVAFRLDLVGKDLDLILELAREVGAPMPQAETNRDVVQAALATGLADHDISALAEYLRAVEQTP